MLSPNTVFEARLSVKSIEGALGGGLHGVCGPVLVDSFRLKRCLARTGKRAGERRGNLMVLLNMSKYFRSAATCSLPSAFYAASVRRPRNKTNYVIKVGSNPIVRRAFGPRNQSSTD